MSDAFLYNSIVNIMCKLLSPNVRINYIYIEHIRKTIFSFHYSLMKNIIYVIIFI